MEIAPEWAVDSSRSHKLLAEVWALRLAADNQFWESGGEFKALRHVGSHLGLDCGMVIGPAIGPQQVVERARTRLAELRPFHCLETGGCVETCDCSDRSLD